MYCEVIEDFLAVGGILIKKGSIGEILKEEDTYLWINVNTEEVGESIPLPIFYQYVKIIDINK